MILDPTFLSGFTLILTGFTGAFLAALWVAAVIWTFRDIRSRHRDRLVHFLAAALVALLNLPGVLVYLIIRPARTLEEEYQQTLEEEALLQTIEDQAQCPGCERHILDDWLVCPTCQTKLRKPCHSCGRLMELPWNICPYCGTPELGMRRDGITMDDVVRDLPKERRRGKEKEAGLEKIKEELKEKEPEEDKAQLQEQEKEQEQEQEEQQVDLDGMTLIQDDEDNPLDPTPAE
jgi:RNA polymerase subunit RPABC4/transcription elongation factor Spt4